MLSLHHSSNHTYLYISFHLHYLNDKTKCAQPNDMINILSSLLVYSIQDLALQAYSVALDNAVEVVRWLGQPSDMLTVHKSVSG